jgi:hypothetical protein
MGDGGSRTLKAAYEDKTLDIPALGLKIGSWLAKFHTSTTSSDLRHKFDNKVGKAVYRHSYNNLATALESQGLDKALGERVNETYGSLLATDDICICHGDFWPGNILLSDHPEAKDLKLTVVDWEMVRNGNGGTDIGQFAAEAWLLDRTRGDRGLLDAFLKGYLEARKLGREDSIRVAVQFGTHIGFWPTRVGWGTKEETGEIVRIGSEILNHVEAEDWAWLGGSDIGVLFAEKD